ncbi:17429_t:CDS:2, partial [Dentiscutata heterogama]
MTDMVDSTEIEIEPYIIINNNVSESILSTTELTDITEKVENEIILNQDIAKNDESKVKADIAKNFEKDINLSKEIKSDPSAAQLDSETCNKGIEQLIQELQLNNDTDFIKWVPYEKFQEIEYLGHGGYGTTYFAKSKEGYINSINLGFGSRARNGEAIVILKHLNNSKEMITDYLNMVKSYNAESSQNRKRNVFGVLPYIPPEVLKGEPYTTAGDIYSLGGIMYEMATNRLPFSDCAHNEQLIYEICDGLRPQFPQDITPDIPQWFINLIYDCWENDPNKRPTAQGLGEIIASLSEANASDERKNRRMKGPSRGGPMLSSIYTKHPDAIFTSKLWPTLYELEQSGFISTASVFPSDLLEYKILPNDEQHLSESKDLLDDKELEESSSLSESYFLDFRSSESFNDSNDSDNTDDTEDFTFSESDAESFDN